MKTVQDANGSTDGAYDFEDAARVKHIRIGVWDLYEERKDSLRSRIPGAATLVQYKEIVQCLPYIRLVLNDMLKIRNGLTLLWLYALVELLLALIPAASLWYSGQLLSVVQTAVETRTVDKSFLLRVFLGHTVCTVVERLLSFAQEELQHPMKTRLQQYYQVHIAHARARLDVPTFGDAVVERQLNDVVLGYFPNAAWSTFEMMASALTITVQTTGQVMVIIRVLKAQPGGLLVAAAIAIAHSGFRLANNRSEYLFRTGLVWAATTRNKDFIRLEGLRALISEARYRTELVAGNLGAYCAAEINRLTENLGDNLGGHLWEMYQRSQRGNIFTVASLFEQCWSALPQVMFALQAVQYPASIPLSLASMHLIEQTANTLGYQLYRFIEQFGSMAEQLVKLRQLYDVAQIPNIVKDGREPFPEDAQKMRAGLAIEFKNVSFKYPGSDTYALRNVSFNIFPGKLCVIVGSNGTGKSTILKLLVHIYDVDEGVVLIDGRDIRSLKLADLRQTMAVLFQDYNHFPLTIRENIALGNPSSEVSDEQIHLAARLGGAEEFIKLLPEGFDTYIDRPVKDTYSGLPPDTRTIFGRPINQWATRDLGLSGGQMQRLAVARTFMRSIVSEESLIGLLLFDEPSASLDPTAEHELFARLRELRGGRTMLFSSHRFGNLTKHADMILFMNGSSVAETGTHDQLLQRDGEYAKVWKLQAQAFL